MSKKYSDDEINIRPAKKADMTELHEMIQELADFEKMPEGPKLTVQDLERDAFETSPPLFKCLVAELRQPAPGGSTLAGSAVYFPTYSTWEGRATMLEDLYVRPAHRRKGVGARLFDGVVKDSYKYGSARLDFHVLDWNPAKAFYLARGAEDLSEKEGWKSFRLLRDTMQKE